MRDRFALDINKMRNGQSDKTPALMKPRVGKQLALMCLDLPHVER